MPRASGTNDKAGTVWNLIRFASPRSAKRNHLAVTDYRYPAPGAMSTRSDVGQPGVPGWTRPVS